MCVCACTHTTICVFFFFTLSLDITKLAFIQLCPQATVCVLILLCVFFFLFYLGGVDDVTMIGHARAGMGYRSKFQTENSKTLLRLYYGVFEELLRPY